MRRTEPVIKEILEAIDGIIRTTANKSIVEFRDDWLLQRGVERALEIISEASQHLPDEILAMAPDIPRKQIRTIGNILRHQYHQVEHEIVCAVVTEHIGPLKIAIDRIQCKLKSG